MPGKKEKTSFQDPLSALWVPCTMKRKKQSTFSVQEECIGKYFLSPYDTPHCLCYQTINSSKHRQQIGFSEILQYLSWRGDKKELGKTLFETNKPKRKVFFAVFVLLKHGRDSMSILTVFFQNPKMPHIALVKSYSPPQLD